MLVVIDGSNERCRLDAALVDAVVRLLRSSTAVRRSVLVVGEGVPVPVTRGGGGRCGHGGTRASMSGDAKSIFVFVVGSPGRSSLI